MDAFRKMDRLIDEALGFVGKDTSDAYYKTLSATLELDARPRAMDAGGLVIRMLGLLRDDWSSRGRPGGAATDWRFETQPRLAPHNRSSEKTLEKTAAMLEGWVNQVPVGSGLWGTGRNIDLVRRVIEGRYEFVELKYGSGDGAGFAALELLGYAAAWLFARRHREELGYRDRPLVEAESVEFIVLAESPFYYRRGRRYDLGWFEERLSAGLQAAAREALGHGTPHLAFRFESFPASFGWRPALGRTVGGEALVEEAMERRSPVYASEGALGR